MQDFYIIAEKIIATLKYNSTKERFLKVFTYTIRSLFVCELNELLCLTEMVR